MIPKSAGLFYSVQKLKKKIISDFRHQCFVWQGIIKEEIMPQENICLYGLSIVPTKQFS